MGRPYKIKRHKRIYRRSAGNIILRVLIIVAAVAALFGIGWMLYTPVSDWISQRQNPDTAVIGESSAQSDGLDVDETTSDQSGVSEETETEDQQQAVLSQAQTAYLPIETVADEQQFAQALELAKEQGYDSILFDLKSSDGTVNYPISYNPSTDALVTGTTTVDLNAVVQQIRDAGLVPMASIYTFRDHRYPSANNAAATQYMDSDFLWVDNDPEKAEKHGSIHSRSRRRTISARLSMTKATGYPIAKVTAKIAVGYGLDEISNAVTGKTKACFEPTLDYCVVKFPRWPFDKFVYADNTLGTQMKATGEVMAIDNSFEGALMKAVRGCEIKLDSMIAPHIQKQSDAEIKKGVSRTDDQRLFHICEALRRGIMTIEEIHDITTMDVFFLHKFQNIIDMEKELAAADKIDSDLYIRAKKMGFLDKTIEQLSGKDISDVKRLPVYKMVDTCAAEFEAETPYYYSTYDEETEVAPPSGKKKVLVLGSGPIRIGQGIEFDYCSVHAVWALQKLGCETVIINNNPETVSTDFDTADRLYFEPLTPEDVTGVVEAEKPDYAIVQFGGQTAIKPCGAP